ncbi:MAG: nucleolar protein 56 [Candidatus Woesearchaeota archaeon]|nr:nucleolar protein 56 [Candidatus Woesearchaeota archaeon]
MNKVYSHILGNFLISKSGKIQKISKEPLKNLQTLNPDSHDIRVFEKVSHYILENHKEELYQKVMDLTKDKLSKLDFKDDYVIQAINAIDDLDKTINLLSKRLRRFILTYLPELSLSSIDNEKLVDLLVSKTRDEILKSENLTKSMGAQISKDAQKVIKEFAFQIKQLFDLRKNLVEFIKSQEEQFMRNFSRVAGPTIAARLLAKAGSIHNLVSMPASTIQLLGAEKALFRHLVSGKKSPKYGILYQHPLVQKVKSRNRGKMARAIADKLAIAIKVDYFDNKDISDELLKELQKRYEECR